MKKLIDKSALVAEIEKLKSIQLSIFSKGETEESCYKSLSCISVYNEVLSFLDILEVKGVDLDYIKKELDEAVRIYKPNGDFGWGTLYNVATHFFELGLKAQKEE